jgi:hypothetical protein
MEPNADFTRPVPNKPGNLFEVGVASWDDGNGTKLSVRHSVYRDGRFDPHSSGEVPIEYLGEMVDRVRDYLQNR